MADPTRVFLIRRRGHFRVHTVPDNPVPGHVAYDFDDRGAAYRYAHALSHRFGWPLKVRTEQRDFNA